MDEPNLLETMCIGRHSYLNKPGSQPRECNELGVEKPAQIVACTDPVLR